MTDSWLLLAMDIIRNQLTQAGIPIQTYKIVPLSNAVGQSGARPAQGIIVTPFRNYLVKGESSWWRNAGKDTGFFTGEGITINKDWWKKVYEAWKGNGTFLYYSSDTGGKVLWFLFRWIKQFRKPWTQKSNNEDVYVFPIAQHKHWQWNAGNDTQ